GGGARAADHQESQAASGTSTASKASASEPLPLGLMPTLDYYMTGQEWPGAPQFSPQSRPPEPTPSYEEVAAKRLNPPSRNEGLLDLIRRYSGPETLAEKIQRHIFSGPPLRPQPGPVKRGPRRIAA